MNINNPPYIKERFFHSTFLTPFLIAATVAFSFISAEIAFGKDAGSDSLTIYSTATPGAISPSLYRPTPRSRVSSGLNLPGYAVIKHERNIVLGNRLSEFLFPDVAALIDPTTVSFKSMTDTATTRVLEQNYKFDLVNQSKLMERYIDHEITVEQGRGDNVEVFTGTLMSAADGLVMKSKDGSVRVIKNYENVIFPELPGGLITRPTLMWKIQTKKPGSHKALVTYQTSGITWWTDYNILFHDGADENSGTLDISAWVSIINKSGASYNDARIKLVAGDVHRAPKYTLRRGQYEQMAMVASRSKHDFKEKSFFEYHLYTLGRTTTLPDNSTKQIELFSTARGVPVKKELVYFGTPGKRRYSKSPDYNSPFTGKLKFRPGKVTVYLKFKNSKENNMGMPLPSGRIRVNKIDPDDNSQEFIGEDIIDHTPKDEEVSITLGSAFDVVGNRKVTAFKVDHSKKRMEETIEIKIRNHKDAPVKVTVKEELYRWFNWKITQSSHNYKKVDGMTVHYPIMVNKDGEAVISYTVIYTW